MAGLVPAIHAFTDIRQSPRPGIAGQKAPTGPREARPDDRLRAVFAPDDPAIREALQSGQTQRFHFLEIRVSLNK
jgi:hypothetical protein